MRLFRRKRRKRPIPPVRPQTERYAQPATSIKVNGKTIKPPDA